VCVCVCVSVCVCKDVGLGCTQETMYYMGPRFPQRKGQVGGTSRPNVKYMEYWARAKVIRGSSTVAFCWQCCNNLLVVNHNAVEGFERQLVDKILHSVYYGNDVIFPHFGAFLLWNFLQTVYFRLFYFLKIERMMPFCTLTLIIILQS